MFKKVFDFDKQLDAFLQIITDTYRINVNVNE